MIILYFLMAYFIWILIRNPVANLMMKWTGGVFGVKFIFLFLVYLILFSLVCYKLYDLSYHIYLKDNERVLEKHRIRRYRKDNKD